MGTSSNWFGVSFENSTFCDLNTSKKRTAATEAHRNHEAAANGYRKPADTVLQSNRASRPANRPPLMPQAATPSLNAGVRGVSILAAEQILAHSQPVSLPGVNQCDTTKSGQYNQWFVLHKFLANAKIRASGLN
jgi:hypothetical protein